MRVAGEYREINHTLFQGCRNCPEQVCAEGSQSFYLELTSYIKVLRQKVTVAMFLLSWGTQSSMHFILSTVPIMSQKNPVYVFITLLLYLLHVILPFMYIHSSNLSRKGKLPERHYYSLNFTMSAWYHTFLSRLEFMTNSISLKLKIIKPPLRKLLKPPFNLISLRSTNLISTIFLHPNLIFLPSGEKLNPTKMKKYCPNWILGNSLPE